MNPHNLPKLTGNGLACALALYLLSSCSSSRFRPEESQFLQEAPQLARASDLPFKRSWRSPNLDWSRYDKVLVKPVSLKHLRHSDKVENNPPQRSQRDLSASALAAYAKEQFTETFREDPERRFQVVPSATSGTVICEIAITEFTPAKPWFNAAVTSLGVVGSAAKEILLNAGSAAAKTTARGLISIEVQFTDAETGRPLLTFADRERGRPSIVNLKDFQQLGHARAHIRTWAKQTLAVIKKDPTEEVYDPFPIDLKFW